MYSLIKTFLDIDNDVYCCSKKAIKMNIPIQNRLSHNRFHYYMMCICYYIFTITTVFTILNYKLFLLSITYLNYNYISISSIIIISNIMDVFMCLYLFEQLKKFMKDILCMCYINNE